MKLIPTSTPTEEHHPNGADITHETTFIDGTFDSLREIIKISDTVAIVASFENQRLVVLDISDPLAMHRLSYLDLAGKPGGMAVDPASGILYVTLFTENLLISVDISNPSSIFLIATRGSAYLESPVGIQIKDGYAYVISSAGSRYLTLFSVTVSGGMTQQYELQLSSYATEPLCIQIGVDRDVLIVGSKSKYLISVDISDVSNPTYIHRRSISSYDKIAFIDDSFVVSGTWDSHLLASTGVDPDTYALSQLQQYTDPAGTDYIQIAGSPHKNLVVIAGASKVTTFDVSNPSDIKTLRYLYTSQVSQPTGMIFVGDYVLISNYGNSAVTVYKIHH